MKATVEIPDILYRKIKMKAAGEGLKIKDLVVSGLEMVLNQSSPQKIRIQLPLVKRKGQEVITLDGEKIAEIEAEIDRSAHAHTR